MVEETGQRGERTRDEIVSAAYRLFIRYGFHGTSMRQVSQEAGIALGGIYNHFSSKEDIFIAVLEANHPYHEIVPALQDAQGETVETVIRNAASQMVAALDRRPEFLNLMFIEIVEFNSQHVPALIERLMPQFLSLITTFVGYQDRLRPIPLPMILRAFIGLFFSYYMTDHLMGPNVPAELRENAMDHFVDILLHGIMKSEAVG